MTGNVHAKCKYEQFSIVLCRRHYLRLSAVNVVFPFICLSQVVLSFPGALTSVSDTFSYRRTFSHFLEKIPLYEKSLFLGKSHV